MSFYGKNALAYTLFISAVYAGIVYIFYKIFVNGLITIKEFNIKSAFTIEEIIGAAIIIVTASTFFTRFVFFNINITYVIACFIVLLISFKNGTLAGTTAGISIGLVLSLLGVEEIAILLILTTIGLFAGIFSKFGKIGTIVGFIIGIISIAYLNGKMPFEIISFQNIIISSILLILISKKVNLQIEDLIGKNKLLNNIGENRLNDNIEAIDKLNVLSNTIIKNLKTDEDDFIDLKREFIETFLDNLEEYEGNILYDELSKNEDIIIEIYSNIQSKEIIVDSDLVSILEKHNNYIFMKDSLVKNDLQEIIKIANRSYKMLQIEQTAKKEKQKQKIKANQSLKNVSKAIIECVGDISSLSTKRYKELEKQIELDMKSNIGEVKYVNIKKAENNKHIVTVGIDIKSIDIFKEQEKILNISKILSKKIEEKIVFQKDYRLNEKNEYIQIYSTEDKYIMQVGTAKISEENSRMSGDCNLQIRLNDGKYVLAIADGMGTGKEAREKSKMAIQTLKELLENGFEKSTSISLINSFLNQTSENESYTSLDISVLDLYSGKAEYIKNGACYTYVKNKKSVKVIKSNQNPLGIMDNVDIYEISDIVSDGDIILMCSDGVYDSKEKIETDWIEEYLKNINTNNVQKIADMLLAEAIDNNHGIANDDMTVIVARITKNK